MKKVTVMKKPPVMKAKARQVFLTFDFESVTLVECDGVQVKTKKALINGGSCKVPVAGCNVGFRVC